MTFGLGLQLSLAVAIGSAPEKMQSPGLVLTVVFGGQVMVGGTLSRTVMVCKQVWTMLHSSVPDQVRRMVPLQGRLPLMASTKVMGCNTASQGSVKEAVPVRAGAVLLSQSTWMLGGQFNVTGWLYLRTTVLQMLALHPFPFTVRQTL